jgi:O-antigen/teichoic acid export membrane protein
MTGLVVRLRRTGGSAFLRAVATLMGGNAVAMAVPILAAPVLGRLYVPSDYGALAQYMAPAAVLAVLASLQFQHAIIAERTDRSAGQVTWLTLLGGLAGAVLTVVMVAVLWRPLLAGSAAGEWLWLLPLTVASAGVIAAGGFLANRHQRYSWMARLAISHMLVTVALSIALGFLGWGADGLLTAYFLGQFVQLVAYLHLLLDLRATIMPWPGMARLRVLVRRHWKFAAFALPSEFSSQINMQMPVFALSALGADATLGAFTRARQLVSMPITVVGQSVAQVFRREASELHRKTGSCRALMRRTALWLFAAGISPCLFFMVFAPWMFSFYLGPDWREAGEIAQILAPMLLLRVVVSPLTTVFLFTGNQALDLKLMITSAVLMALFIGTGCILGGTALSVIWAFALCYGVIYLIYIIASFRVAGS